MIQNNPTKKNVFFFFLIVYLLVPYGYKRGKIRSQNKT